MSKPHTSMTALRTHVYACLGPPLTIVFAFKFLMIACVLQLYSRQNEREGLLPDSRVGVKESESEDDLS